MTIAARLYLRATRRERAAISEAGYALDGISLSSREEAAEALDQSIDATHSALHRARAAIEDKIAHRDPGAFGRPEDEAVVARYVHAIAEADVNAMIALIHDDMHTTMPPSPTWIRGYADNVSFYRRMFARWSPGTAKVVPIVVNGEFGFEFHREGELRAIEVVELREGKILRMHHFMQPGVIDLFRR